MDIEEIIRKFFGTILICVALFFAYAGFKAIAELPELNRTIKTLTIVDDGLVHKENEGKLVAVVYDFTSCDDALDPDFNIRFHAPFVRRFVQKLHRTGFNYYWQAANIVSDEKIKDAAFIGDFKDGQALVIDDDLLISVGASRQASYSSYYEEDIKRITEEYYLIDYNTQFWFSKAPPELMGDYIEKQSSIDPYYYEQYEGSFRVRYNTIELKNNKKITVIGRQSGNTLVKDETLDTFPVFEKDTINGILFESNMNMLLGLMIGLSIAFIVLLYGLSFFR